MKQLLVGGPLLGKRGQSHEKDVVSWDQFEPIITPEIVLGKQQSQRFILLPHQRHISVLAYNTGNQVLTLIPYHEGEEVGEESKVLVESVCLMKESKKVRTTVQEAMDKMDEDSDSGVDASLIEDSIEEVIVMVGCSDGTIREFCLSSLANAFEKQQTMDCGLYQISGPCLRPRRVVQVTRKEPIMHLAVPVISHLDEGILTYVVARTKDLDKSALEDKKAISNTNVAVLRVLIPHYDGSKKTSLLSKTQDGVQRKRHIDSIKCRVGKDKTNLFLNTTPFRLLTVSRQTSNKSSVGDAIFLILARANSIHIYYEKIKSTTQFSPMAYPISPTNPLSAISVAKSTNDITCGFYSGEIKVLNNVLDSLENYNVAAAEKSIALGTGGGKPAVTMPNDPRKEHITSKVHWHAHPVTSLAHDAVSPTMDPILYSGGEESVLVTWQTSRGTDRPVDVLPRLALGSIVHVVCADKIDSKPSNGILVYCEDNTLQLFESHNKGRKWKLHGLACKPSDTGVSSEVCIERDPRSKGSSDTTLVISGLPEAPGLMHWYDPNKQRLLSTLEVAAFNRVSRTEEGESQLPTPSITNHAFSDDGDTLITLEETPTENLYVGAYDKRGWEEHGIVSAIRFWSWNEASSSDGRAPYMPSAAMTYPHGPKNRVSALAISKNGLIACTVSNTEKAFRMWQKVDPGNDDSQTVPTWTCRFKVSVPAGLSNFLTSKNAVAFSDDGSIVAIGFGAMVTLWDSEEARFLTTIRHLEDFNDQIDAIKFVSAGQINDLLLVKSAHGVSLQSPFQQSANYKGWSWGIPTSVKAFTVTDAEMIDSHDCIAVAVFDATKNSSRIIFIDAIMGIPGVKAETSEDLRISNEINGVVHALCAPAEKEISSNWSKDSRKNTQPLSLFSLMSSGLLLKFTDIATDTSTDTHDWRKGSIETGPRLDIERKGRSKRKRLERSEQNKDSSTAEGKDAVQIFGQHLTGNAKAAPPPTSELPSLSAAFVNAFVRRKFVKKNTA